MRVFVLGTGRCGTVSFIEACRHLTNYSAGHETRAALIGSERFDYPERHIEADNRLSWLLGELGRRHPDAYYVHLRRDRQATVESFAARADSPFRASLYRAFAHGIVMRRQDWHDPVEVAGFMVDTITANIDAFLEGRASETIWLEEAHAAFPGFLERIGAEGDLDAAVAEWQVRHNARQ